jgi:diguanylate cyclase (GGDEF)-like protein
MERSRKRTAMIYRSKAVCAIALAVGFGCAVFGVGGAGAGDGAYVHHLQQVRLENLALAHRSPEQLVLAMTPNLSSPAATDATPAPAPATTDPASTAAATTTSTAPAPTPTDASTTTTATTTTPTPTDTTTTPTDTSTTPTDTTTTPTPTTTDTTSTTDTSTTPTDTTTTPTTSTGTTTTDTTATDTTTTGTPDASSTPVVHGRQPGTTGSGSTTTSCHGRCDGLTGSSGVVPASLPSSNSSASSSNSLSTGSVTTAALTAAPITNDASSSLLNPVSSPAPATTTTPAPTTSTPTTTLSGPPLATSLESIVKSSTSAISDLTHGTGARNSTATLPTGGTGGATAGGTTGTGPTGAATAGTAAAAAAAGATHTSAHHNAKTHPSSGGSGITAPIDSSVKYITQFVSVVPTAVWVALGAVFALMLALAGLALRSSRREKEFAAISAAALTDALTGILNRRGFTEAAERELARASRYERPFVLAYVDVRGLKTVNDTEGHLMGDELIKTVAGLMKESARADDVVGRIGGDEFALLLGEQTAESAGPVVRRIKAHVAEARAAMEISVPWELTIGMASFPDDGATLEELLNVADRRLYEQRGIALR